MPPAGSSPRFIAAGQPYNPNAAADCAAVGLFGAGVICVGAFASLQYVVSSAKNPSIPNSRREWVRHRPLTRPFKSWCPAAMRPAMQPRILRTAIKSMAFVRAGQLTPPRRSFPMANGDTIGRCPRLVGCTCWPRRCLPRRPSLRRPHQECWQLLSY